MAKGRPDQISRRRQRPLEVHALVVEPWTLGNIRCREVREHALEAEVRARQQRWQGSPQIVVAEPEAVHARVDLEVIPERRLAPTCRGLHGPRRAW
jgi:hypothetical protein